jgi:hypothetical protein
MVELALTIIGFAAAMSIPAFLAAIVESAVRPLSVRAKSSTLAKSHRLLRARRDLPAAPARSAI